MLAWPVMSRAPAFASVVAVSLLSTSFAFAQLPPSEVLPPTPPRAAATAPTTTTPPVTAASVLAPVAGWNLAAPAEGQVDDPFGDATRAAALR